MLDGPPEMGTIVNSKEPVLFEKPKRLTGKYQTTYDELGPFKV